VEVFALSEEEIRIDSKLDDDLGLDSYGKIELFYALQDTFDIGLSQNLKSFPRISTVGDIVSFVESLLN
jgi:acyl carrier protein